MNDISNGELNFTNSEEFADWLETQPHAAQAVITARAALRLAPTLQRRTSKIRARQFADLTFSALWAMALAWAAARYPTRIKKLRATEASSAAAFFSEIDYPTNSQAISSAVAAAAAVVGDPCDIAQAILWAVSNDDENKIVKAELWEAVFDDASRLKTISSSVLASMPLRRRGMPIRAQEEWRDLQTALNAPHWKPWLDWYRRRLNGVEESEEIELLFATLPVDPREKDVAEQNASLARRIVELRKSSGSGEKPLPNAIENISAPFDFGWNAAHRVAVVAGPQNTPIFPFADSDRDHHDRLDACRKTVERLIADLAAQRFNARPDYRLVLETYLEELPAAPGVGNFLLADAEARVLRGLFEEDANILARALAERLNRVLEFHIGLRPYYPGVGRFYDDVRSGALSAPLPRDAIAGFVDIVREYTPDIFEPSVSRGIDKVEEDFAPHPAAPAPQLEPGVLAPRPDPIDAPDPEKAQAFSITSTINAVYRAFYKGQDMAAAIKGWDEAAQKLGEHAGPVIEFLKNFLPQ